MVISMSIYSNLRKVELQSKKIIKSPTGAEKTSWVTEKHINMAIYDSNMYKSDNNINVQSIKYLESSHVGLTKFKDIKEDKNRISFNGKIFDVISTTNGGRYSIILLKEVDLNE